MTKHYPFIATFILGILFGWLASPDKEQTIKETIDTTYVYIHDTTEIVDTAIVIRPEIRYITRFIHDTLLQIDTLKFYSDAKTFDDSAWVNHEIGIDPLDVMTYSKWEYRPGPKTVITKEVTKKVYPGKLEKIVKAGAWILVGAGMEATMERMR